MFFTSPASVSFMRATPALPRDPSPPLNSAPPSIPCREDNCDGTCNCDSESPGAACADPNSVAGTVEELSVVLIAPDVDTPAAVLLIASLSGLRRDSATLGDGKLERRRRPPGEVSRIRDCASDCISVKLVAGPVIWHWRNSSLYPKPLKPVDSAL